MVTVPLCVAEIAPKKYSRLYGTLHQISIGTGMIVAMSLSIPFGKSFVWRYVLVIGMGLGILLFLGSFRMGRGERRVKDEEGDDEETPLVQRDGMSSSTFSGKLAPTGIGEGEKPLSVTQILTTKDPLIKRGREYPSTSQSRSQLYGSTRRDRFHDFRSGRWDLPWSVPSLAPSSYRI